MGSSPVVGMLTSPLAPRTPHTQADAREPARPSARGRTHAFACAGALPHPLSRRHSRVSTCAAAGLVSSLGHIPQWLERLTADQQVPGSIPGVPSILPGAQAPGHLPHAAMRAVEPWARGAGPRVSLARRGGPLRGFPCPALHLSLSLSLYSAVSLSLSLSLRLLSALLTLSVCLPLSLSPGLSLSLLAS